jgi:hypothetical protein
LISREQQSTVSGRSSTTDSHGNLMRTFDITSRHTTGFALDEILKVTIALSDKSTGTIYRHSEFDDLDEIPEEKWDSAELEHHG